MTERVETAVMAIQTMLKKLEIWPHDLTCKVKQYPLNRIETIFLEYSTPEGKHQRTVHFTFDMAEKDLNNVIEIFCHELDAVLEEIRTAKF